MTVVIMTNQKDYKAMHIIGHLSEYLKLLKINVKFETTKENYYQECSWILREKIIYISLTCYLFILWYTLATLSIACDIKPEGAFH